MLNLACVQQGIIHAEVFNSVVQQNELLRIINTGALPRLCFRTVLVSDAENLIPPGWPLMQAGVLLSSLLLPPSLYRFLTPNSLHTDVVTQILYSIVLFSYRSLSRLALILILIFKHFLNYICWKLCIQLSWRVVPRRGPSPMSGKLASWRRN
jgi:hypothetical protein